MFSLARFTRLAYLAAAMVATLAYQSSMARGDDTAAGRDDSVASQYVQLALAHEAHGRSEISRQLFEAAVLESPDYAPAHWHLGHVQVDGQWLAAADAQSAGAQCDTLSLYRELREKALDDPRREMSLARWCRRQGWSDHEKLHYSRVALNPNADERLRADAMRELDLVNVNGQILTEDEVAYLQEQAERVEAAMKKWRGPLEDWALAIVGDDAAKAAAAAEELANVDDPDVVPVVESFLLQSGPVFGNHLVALLGQFPQIQSTESLARFAVLSPWKNVRQDAIDHLALRPLHDFVPMFLDALVAPVQSQYLITFSAEGIIHYRHMLLRNDANAIRIAASDQVTLPATIRVFDEDIDTLPVRQREAMQELQDNAAAKLLRTRIRAAILEQEVSQANTPIVIHNQPVFEALEGTTTHVLRRDPAAWQQWWQEYNEASPYKPIHYTYSSTRSFVAQPMPSHSCFCAGTSVWTEAGLMPIESVQVGDRVLSQDLDSGELTYKIVLRTTAAPPTSETVRVTLDGESIDMTSGHVVWVSGKGWQMAKELEQGNHLHGVSGAKDVYSVTELPPELEVYNLVVADYNTFFVGESGMLVHDITYVTRRRSTTAVVPGFAPGERAQPADVLSLPPKSLVRQVRDGFRQ